ncbi:MAG: 5-formyltetrahydrofolate cyclo-ligase [Akkermansiaceae bacterium]
MTNPDDKLAAYLGGQMNPLQRKEQMREELRRRFDANGEEDCTGVVCEIVKYLEERPELQHVAIFSALPGEVDLRSLPEQVERTWVFPKVIGEELVFRVVRSFEDDMECGSFGIMEPKDELESMSVDEIDLFLCPGLGFDVRGGRIGRGKGFYDRMLSRARPNAVKLGVCFGYQIVDEVVMDEHDVRMNGVIAG